MLKGTHHRKESKEKLRLFNLGRCHSVEAKQKMSANKKGQKVSEETKLKLSLAFKGKPKSENTKRKMSEYWKGRKKRPFSESHRRKMSEARKNEKHYNWKGGLSSISDVIRRSIEYKLWRTAVFERDNWTCVWCNKRGVKLNADHIKPFAHYPELRFAIDNGRTLCVSCHKTTDTFGGRTH